MVARSLASGQRWSWVSAYVLSTLSVLPLLAPEVWGGFRLALADPVLGVIASTEQPLSLRSPDGPWAMGLALAWWVMAYWQRRCAPWEAALVLIGGTTALLRAGNAWLDAAAMLLPIARQLSLARLRPTENVALAAISLAAVVAVLGLTKPPALPQAAREAAAATTSHGPVFADWRWAPDLQRQLGADRTVLASAGMASEPADFWLDYLRVVQGHSRWVDLLGQWQVDLVVLESVDQQRQLAELIRSASDWRVIYDASDALVAQRANL